jgi:prepilin-type processing-associated H-X9-DG protein
VQRLPLQLFPYTKSTAIWVCSSDPTDGKTYYDDNGTSNPYVNSYGKPVPNSYASNEVMYWQPYTDAPVAESEVLYPSNTYYLADANPWFQTFSPWWDQGFNRARFSRECPGMVISGQVDLPKANQNDSCARHLGGSVWLFADGHAKWEKWSQSKRYQAHYGAPNRTEM